MFSHVFHVWSGNDKRVWVESEIWSSLLKMHHSSTSIITTITSARPLWTTLSCQWQLFQNSVYIYTLSFLLQLRYHSVLKRETFEKLRINCLVSAGLHTWVKVILREPLPVWFANRSGFCPSLTLSALPSFALFSVIPLKRSPAFRLPFFPARGNRFSSG